MPSSSRFLPQSRGNGHFAFIFFATCVAMGYVYANEQASFSKDEPDWQRGSVDVFIRCCHWAKVEGRFSRARLGIGRDDHQPSKFFDVVRPATAASLARQYLRRIHDLDKGGPKLNSVIELNPDALSIAEALDLERRKNGPRGPLHGIPILIKDNIATHDKMQTTAGSLALVGSVPPSDAFLVKRLRAAGAVILGKTNLSEWANARSIHATSGWSGRGGLTLNPYVLDRNTSGSSSGSAVAVSANLCAVAVGTETDGSVTSPASYNGLVGIKPTLGLVSRSGIIPIAHSQDTAGPMARTVADTAILLGCMAGLDSDDPATSSAAGKIAPDYSRFLDVAALQGARIGVARKFCGFLDAVDQLMEEAITAMKSQGALISDPSDLPS